MTNKQITFLVGTGLALVLFLSMCVRIVGVGQVGIVSRFGKVTREVPSGLTVKAPWPIERIVNLNVQVQKEQDDTQAATADLQDVTATLALNYNLERGKVRQVYERIGTDYKNRIIAPAVQEAFKATSAQYTANDLLTKRPEVKAKALSVLRTRLESQGITVDDLSIVNFKFSDDFTKSIEQKQVAQQNAERAQFELQKAQLDAQAQNVQKASLSAELLQKYAIDKWNGQMPQYVGGGSVFNIPLTK